MDVVLNTGPARCNYKEYSITVYVNETEEIKKVIIPSKVSTTSYLAFGLLCISIAKVKL